MSRRPTTTNGKPAMARVTSMSSLAPPARSTGAARANGVSSAAGPSRVVSNGGNRSEPEAGPSTKRATAGGIEVGETNINVVVRLRGRSTQELESMSPIVATATGALSKAIAIGNGAPASALASGGAGGDTKTYPFDKVFGPEADQTMVFNEVAEGMLDEVLAGYNCTIFAYGQTGTGKTYTMQGELGLSPLNMPKDTAGIVPRVIHRLFSVLDAKENTDYSIKCSYVELYNEELRDLLSHDYGTPAVNGHPALKLYEDGKKGTMISGLEEVGLKDLTHALKVLNKGVQRRQTAETKMNTESSRSHTVITITVHVKETGSGTHNEDVLRIGKFNLVDLAGSEAIGRSGATDKRAREAGMINQSLLTLGRVISALVDKASHIPYRESKLTRLLQDSLGGRTKTCIVATISPTRSNMEETLSTLEYALRARDIRNRPELNAHLTKSGLLKEYLGDIERLKAEVIAAREKNGIYVPDEEWTEMTERQTQTASDLVEARQRASAAAVELSTKKREFEDLIAKCVATNEELETTRKAEKELGEMLEQTNAELDAATRRLTEEKVVSQAYADGEQRLHGVADGLRGVALESVGDVGGLFDKLARKAKVLGSNADAATTFGADLQGLADDLRSGLLELSMAQESMGSRLNSEMSSHAARGKEIAGRDISSLEAALKAFTDLSHSLSQSIKLGKVEALDRSKEVMSVKDQVESFVKSWAQDLGARSDQLVEELLAHQQQNLATVRGVLSSTCNIVDVVVTAAQHHIAAESQASERFHRLAVDTSAAEIGRLRSQNALLTQLLAQEKATTAKLRTDLIANFTTMITEFTETQESSWTKAMGQIQQENEASMKGMERFSTESMSLYDDGQSSRQDVQRELNRAKQNGQDQHEAGQVTLDAISTKLTEDLTAYSITTKEEVEKCDLLIDEATSSLASTAKNMSSRAEVMANEQKDHLKQLLKGAKTTHDTSVARCERVSEDIEHLTTTLLDAHAASSETFSEAHASTSATLESLIDRTAAFLSEEILEDVPTGITPRKKNWSIQTTWERIQPREALLAAMRQRQRSEPVTTGQPKPAPSGSRRPNGQPILGSDADERESSSPGLAEIDPNTLAFIASPQTSFSNDHDAKSKSRSSLSLPSDRGMSPPSVGQAYDATSNFVPRQSAFPIGGNAASKPRPKVVGSGIGSIKREEGLGGGRMTTSASGDVGVRRTKR